MLSLVPLLDRPCCIDLWVYIVGSESEVSGTEEAVVVVVEEMVVVVVSWRTFSGAGCSV